MSEQREFWEQVRRGIMQMVAPLVKSRPNDRYTIDVRVVERTTSQT
jgi:hypothetical protein